MLNKTFKSLLAVSAASVAIVGAANAGGFSRGDADTQIIYEEGNFNMRSSVTIVSPTREYTKANNPALVGQDYADTYVVPSAAIKMNVTDDLRCAGTVVNNNGAKSTQVGGNTQVAPGVFVGTYHTDLATYEIGATCGYKFDLAKGRAWIVGGVFGETMSAEKEFFSGPGATGTLDVRGTDVGYRIGAAYEIPEIALRTELMYRSGTNYGASGKYTLAGGLFVAPATGYTDLPQSVDLNVQSGIAPGWLAFGSVKWTDWSVTKIFDVYSPTAPAALRRAVDSFYWRDGWTVTGGIGHAFNEQVSGLVALTWDRGTGTGYDLSGDTWTLSAGGSFKDSIGGELRAGVGLSLLGSAEDYKFHPAERVGANTAVGTDWSIAGNVGYAVKW